jgi:hypothetical protein
LKDLFGGADPLSDDDDDDLPSFLK